MHLAAAQFVRRLSVLILTRVLGCTWVAVAVAAPPHGADGEDLAGFGDDTIGVEIEI